MRKYYIIDEYGAYADYSQLPRTYVYSSDDGWWVTKLTGAVNGDDHTNWDNCVYKKGPVEDNLRVVLRLCEVFQV